MRRKCSNTHTLSKGHCSRAADKNEKQNDLFHIVQLNPEPGILLLMLNMIFTFKTPVSTPWEVHLLHYIPLSNREYYLEILLLTPLLDLRLSTRNWLLGRIYQT